MARKPRNPTDKKPKRTPPPAEKNPTPRKPSAWRAGLFQMVFTFAFLVALGYGVVLLGQYSREKVSERSRYQLPFSALDFELPKHLDRATFLNEIFPPGGISEPFPAYDDDALANIRNAFAQHPWVEAVDGGELTPDRRYKLALRFRTPIMVVTVRGKPNTLRMVDARAVLFPEGPVWEQLCLLVGTYAPPATPPGTVWADATISRAAELARDYHPKQLEKTTKRWRLIQQNDLA